MDVVKPKESLRWNSFYWIGIPLAVFILFSSFFIWIELKKNELNHLNCQIHPGLPYLALACGSVAAILVLIIFYFHSQSRASTLKIIQAKRESQHMAAHLQKILSTVNEGFISFDEKGVLIDWNPYAEKILGWEKNKVLGKNVYDLVIPKRNHASHKETIKRFIETEEVGLFKREIEFSAIKQDGNEFPVEVVILPLKLDEKYIFYAFIRDITVRKKLEIDQARLTSIIDSSDDAILSSDLNGVIVTWNRGAEKLYGYKAKEAVGKSVELIYPNREQINSILEKIKQGHHIQNHNTTRTAKGGKVIPVSVAITPIRDKKGKIIGVSSITRDMTERNKVEKMKNEFLSIVSHELRTPLTSIRGSLGLLASEKICVLTGKAKRLIEIANNNCERLVRLINDILDIEKIEAGKMEFQFKLLDLNKLTQECIEANYQFAAKYNVNIEFFSSSQQMIRGDYDRLTQVITNLLSNAIRYSPQDEVVKIQIIDKGDMVRFSIIDHGPGIPTDFQDKIFGKFTQADSSPTRKISGTGLGLNISKSIIEKHGGTISFISKPGQGATFYFDLPKQLPAENRAEETEKKNEKILICDPNFDSAYHLKNLFLRKKIEADIANTVKQAKMMIKENNYSLITVDLLLPDEDGISFIKDLRHDTKSHDIPIIVLTSEKEKNELKIEGFHVINWFEKPINEEKSAKIIDYINKNFPHKISNILSIEDDNDVTQLIALLLQGKARVWNANSLQQAKKLLQDQEFDLVILDLNLPDGTGTELLPCINIKTKEFIPIIVFSIDELDQKYSHLVKQALLKSKVTNEQLFHAIESAMQKVEE